MSIFSSRLKYVTCKVWETSDGFVFPEVSPDNPDRQNLLARPNTGICLSGGGTRSATCSIGQLRGLSHLGLLNSVRYLSCVSGGSWAGVPFTYLPQGRNDRGFLGSIVDPASLTEENLRNIDRNSYLHAVTHADIFEEFIKNAALHGGDETYSRALGDIFLKRFGLDSLKRFFGYNAGTVQLSLELNENAEESDFYIARASRPYLIAGGTILRIENPPPSNRIQIEMTPMYTGVYPVQKGAGSEKQNIGGGYIESFAFDSDAPTDFLSGASPVTVRLGARRHRFTLSDVIGTSGAAPAEALDKLGLDWVGFPEYKYWPVQLAPEISLKSKEYEFGDGGTLEDSGIMPLLLRKVKRIVAFVNTDEPLKGPHDIDDSIPKLFGRNGKTNRVFEEKQYQPLIDGLLKAKSSKKTVMFQDTYSVQANSHYGIEGEWPVEVMWIYNDNVPDWEALLPPDIRSKIGHGSLGNFPHYNTFFQNPPKVIELSAMQANLLANLSAWNVVINEKQFRAMLT